MATRRALDVRLGGPGEALDRLEAKWNLIAEGARLEPEHILTLPDLRALLAALSPARWDLLARLRAAGPLSVYELARRLERDYKNVHTDVKRLAELGLIERRGASLVAVGWDLVRAEVRLSA
jgi:predicted transcriptional regulator